MFKSLALFGFVLATIFSPVMAPRQGAVPAPMFERLESGAPETPHNNRAAYQAAAAAAAAAAVAAGALIIHGVGTPDSVQHLSAEDLQPQVKDGNCRIYVPRLQGRKLALM